MKERERKRIRRMDRKSAKERRERERIKEVYRKKCEGKKGEGGNKGGP